MKVKVLQNIMAANDQIAVRNQQLLDTNKVLAINIMSSPGAGKTSLVLQTIRGLKGRVKIAVVEGDIASTIDADRISKEEVPVVQINTGGQCHIDANMISNALESLSLDDINLLLIENVGNLVCPAEFQTGAHKSVMLLSVPEGDDKPYKYPLMFSICEAIIVNKIDFLPLSDFNLADFQQTVKGLNPEASIFQVSCKTGAGIDGWVSWLESEIKGR
ncbi:hydrogenase nickel incorporation protein HypB [Chloroflexota bacterium]